jgi:ribonuclease E
LSLVRIIEEEALKENSGRVDVQVPVDVATYLLNEKRAAIAEVEKQTGISVMVIANLSLETPQYKVERVRKAELAEEDVVASYRHAEIVEQNYDPEQYREALIQPEQAAVQRVIPTKPLPKATAQPAPAPAPKKAGLLTGLISLFVGGDAEKKADKASSEKVEAKEKPKTRSSSTRTGSGQRGSRGGRGRGGRNRNRPRSDQKQKAPQKQSDDTSKQQTTEPAARQKPQTKSTSAEQGPQQESLDKSTDKPAKSGSRRSRRGGGRRRRDPNAADNKTPATDTPTDSAKAASKPEQSGNTAGASDAQQVKSDAPKAQSNSQPDQQSNQQPKQQPVSESSSPRPPAPSSAQSSAPPASQSSAPASAPAAPAPVASAPAPAAVKSTGESSTAAHSKPADKVTSND